MSIYDGETKGIPKITYRTANGASISFRKSILQRYLDLLGDDLRAFLPFYHQDPPTTGALVTDAGPKGHHFTNETAFDYDPFLKGKILAYDFNGSDEALSLADHDDFSFGNGTSDEAVSMGAWVLLKAVASNIIVSRLDATTGATENEFYFGTQAGGKPIIRLYDDSAGAYIGRRYDTAIAARTWYFIVATYDGSAAATGVNIYIDGDEVDDTDETSGTYVAMENKTVVTAIGYRKSALGAKEWYFDGYMWGPFITGEELSQATIRELCRIGNYLLEV